MNIEVAREVFELQYKSDNSVMTFEKFTELLEKGLELIRCNPNTDKMFVNRFYKDNELRAVNIALIYNEQLMVRMLLH